jgi:hypothetical protein
VNSEKQKAIENQRIFCSIPMNVDGIGENAKEKDQKLTEIDRLVAEI